MLSIEMKSIILSVIYAECRNEVIMLSAIMLGVSMLNVVAP
jgi:hypothetical protein